MVGGAVSGGVPTTGGLLTGGELGGVGVPVIMGNPTGAAGDIAPPTGSTGGTGAPLPLPATMEPPTGDDVASLSAAQPISAPAARAKIPECVVRLITHNLIPRVDARSRVDHRKSHSSPAAQQAHSKVHGNPDERRPPPGGF
jgi:hypothetical protein